MKDTTVAARYARALFIITERRGETARALEDAKALLPVMEHGGRIASFLASPQARLPEKRAALERAFEGRVLPTVAIFVDLLLRKKRLSEFTTIVGSVKFAKGVNTVTPGMVGQWQKGEFEIVWPQSWQTGTAVVPKPAWA